MIKKVLVSREYYEKMYNLYKVIDAIYLYEKLLGKNWIRKQVKRRNKANKDSRYYFLCESENVHPVIQNWPLDPDSLDANRKRKNRKEIHPIQQLNLVAPAYYIKNAMNIEGFDKRTKKARLRNPIGFRSFVYECKIASAFHRLGYNVEFLPETNKPTPDFLVKCNEGPVFVECKKKMFTQKEQEYREKTCNIAKVILEVMDLVKQNLFVQIYSKDVMENIEPSEIAAYLRDQLQKGLTSGDFSADGVEVTWKQLSKFNCENYGSFQITLKEEPYYLITTTEISVNQSGGIKYRNPRVIAFYIDTNFDHVTPLVIRLKESLRQIEEYSPALVNLEIDRRMKPSELERAEERIKNLFDLKSKKHDKRTKNIKYCILSAIELINDGRTIGERTISRVIENEYSKVDLPKSFFIFGKWFLGNANPERILAEGDKLREKKKYKEAISHYDLALKINSYLVQVWNNKGEVLNEIRNYSEAINCFERALEIKPDYIRAWINKGIALINLGQIQKALECYRIANYYLKLLKSEKSEK